MWRRLRLSVRMLNISLRVLWHHPEFLLFPLVSAMALVVILVIMSTGALALVDFDLGVYTRLGFWGKTGVFFVLYFVAYLVAFFANTGLVGAVLTAMEGGTPTVRESFAIARARTGKLVVYAAIMSTVGIVLRMISSWLGLPGRLAGPVVRRVVVFSFVGLAWNLITYLVVPILVVENIGPRQAIQRSTALIKKTWGEQVVAYVSTGMLFLVFMALWLSLTGPTLTRAVTTLNEPVITATIYVLVMVPLVLFIIKLAVDSIFCTIVYRYVTDADLGEFDAELLQASFAARSGGMWQRLRGRKS